ncbi:MAG: YfiR family protein [Desulfobacteraceae bacterium]|jgi:hypothetical protein
MAKANTIGEFIESCICRTALFVFLLCGLFLCDPTRALCDPVTGPEYEVKLGFIYNFINFVTWPETAFKSGSDALTLCLASDNPFSEVLYKLDGKTIKGKTLNVIDYQEETCLEQSHILFFATQDRALIEQILNLIKGRSILTIGETEGFTRMGGTINFFKERNRLRFKINIDAARRNSLKMSSQLLGSAKIVREERK